MFKRPRAILSWSVVCSLSVACSGTIGTLDSDDTPPGTGADPGRGASGQDDSVAPEHMRRLTRLEYDNTVRDLLGDDSRLAEAFASDTEANGSGYLRGGAVSTVDADQLRDAAEKLGMNVVGNLPAILQCNPMPTGRAAEDACARDFIGRFARRAYRRPVVADEAGALTAYYTQVRTDLSYGFSDAIRMVIQAILQSPNFLYRWELGNDPALKEGDLVRFNDHEIASRLSYALWASMPDGALFASADAGQLRTAADVEKQARRMLADPKAKDMFSDFDGQWLGLGALANVTKDTKVYPLFTPALAQSMENERREFISYVLGTKGDGRLETMLTAPFSFIDNNLATLYGDASVTGGAVRQVMLDPTRRSGILTQPAFLTAHAAPGGSHPVQRGKEVLVRLLCIDLPPPPPNVPALPPPTAGLTTRERFAQHSQNACAKGCHDQMDPLGFAFEGYDGIGMFRTTDAGKPVDASGAIKLGDKTVTFHDAIELTKALSTAGEVRSCVTRQLLRYGLKRHEAPGDDAAMAFVDHEFERSSFDLREALVALAVSRSFFYRQPAAGEVLP